MNPKGVDAAVSHQATMRTPLAKSRESNYGSVNIFGNAKVQLGDRYGANQDLFESGSEEEQRNCKSYV